MKIHFGEPKFQKRYDSLDEMYDWQPLNIKKLSGGEPAFNLDEYRNEEMVIAEIALRLTGYDLEEILFLSFLDQYFRSRSITYRVYIIHLPFSRPANEKNKYEPFSEYPLKTFFNTLDYEKLVTYDLPNRTHFFGLDVSYYSDIDYPRKDSFFGIRNFCTVRRYDCLSRSIHMAVRTKKYDLIVSPDKEAFGNNRYISSDCRVDHLACQRIMDENTNKLQSITPIKIHQQKDRLRDTFTDLDSLEKIKGKKLIVMDDCCDTGETFIVLAKALQKYKPKQIDLHVTHGIFSNGLDELKKYYTNIVCKFPADSVKIANTNRPLDWK